jgi:heme/copper-type cytochrome/quinol oxidase subunit 2
MQPILPKPAERFRAAATLAALIFGGLLAGPAWVFAESKDDQLPDLISTASKEAFELITAPRAAPADLTIKIVGYQYHWSYSYTNPPGPEFKGSADSSQPQMDSDIVVPQGKSVELIVTANDQVYDLVIRELGLSLTAIPGRVQSQTLLTKNVGRLVAVCSSDCDAAGHADAIVFQVVTPEDYEQWLSRKLGKRP